MSIVAFKKKSAIRFGSHISGRKPGGTWIFRGPHGQGMVVGENDNGFSINGGHRNKGAVGTPMAFSKTKTIFRGQYAVGWGGNGTTYYDKPLFVVNQAVIVPGTQYKYIKPSVLSTSGMLHTKYKWAYNGQYPNYWVKNIFTSPLKDNKSQGVYVSNKTSENICVYTKPEMQGIPTESQYITSIAKPCIVAPHFPDVQLVGKTVGNC